MKTWVKAVTAATVGYVGYQVYSLAGPADCELSLYSAKIKTCYFANRVVWVTGASSGIGKRLAFALAALGVPITLILSARSTEKLKTIRDQILRAHDKCKVELIPLDLGDLEELPSKAGQALQLFGRVDILVNNGGIAMKGLCSEADFEQVDHKTLAVNFLSGVRLCKALLPSWKHRLDGHIVNMSSLAGKMGLPHRSAYCASKFAMQGFYDSLRAEECSNGLSITNICPGTVNTSQEPNMAGMDVDRCCELILVAISNQMEEVWLWGDKSEMLAAYLNQYMPASLRRLTRS